MSIKNKLEQIGKEGTITTENGLSIVVVIKDFKNSYGRDRWLVEPKEGSGQAWVQNVQLIVKK